MSWDSCEVSNEIIPVEDLEGDITDAINGSLCAGPLSGATLNIRWYRLSDEEVVFGARLFPWR
jgi:hypothetical protein